MIKKILLALVVILIAIQFIPIDFTNPGVVPEKDFFAVNSANEETKAIIKSSCYDCHSNETIYPDYFKIAPINFYMNHHIEEGREHLNFSNWTDYTEKKRAHKLEESIEEIEEGKMPMKAYIFLHSKADLTQEQKDLLVNYLKEAQ